MSSTSYEPSTRTPATAPRTAPTTTSTTDSPTVPSPSPGSGPVPTIASAPRPPPPPPLPPQQYGSRAANVLVRFAQPFIYGSRPPSADGDRPGDHRLIGLTSGTSGGSSPLLSRNATHRTGIPIAALDISPDRTHVILAGRDILKTVQVLGSSCVEDSNLRAAIINYAATHNTLGGAISAKHKDQLAANDVKWSHGKYDTTIATAAANGQIVIYDINRPGIEFARLHEHVRQVHRVAFNPHQGALLLSGSQDATMRLWDLRSLAGDRSVMTCRSAYQYPGNNEGIRDLRWSPTNGVEFAAGTDNGVIQRWDLRKNRSPLLRVNAHEKTCHSVDWNPDGKHLVSGGADKFVNVWDFSSTDRRKKPCWQIRAPQAVLNVRWRPSTWHADGNDPGSWQCAQVATSYDYQDPRIHIWDFRRPHVPFREIDQYDTPPTAMLWHSENLLWSAGLLGIFTQSDISFSSSTLDRRSDSVFAISSTGKINFFSEPKVSKRKHLPDTPNEFLDRHKKTSFNGEKLSGSHSATDGSLEEVSLLSSSFRTRHRKSPSTKSSKSIGGTPPPAGTGGPTLRLDEIMQKEFDFHAQAAAFGNIFGLFDPAAFRYLAQHCSIGSVRPNSNLSDRNTVLSALFRRNSVLAASVGQYRLAQSWTILGFAVEKDAQSWAQGSGLGQLNKFAPFKQSNNLLATGGAVASAQDHNKDKSKKSFEKPKSKLVAPAACDTSSNMTTPIARPVSDRPTDTAKLGYASALEGDDGFSLPGPVWDEISTHQAKINHSFSDPQEFQALHNITNHDRKALDEPVVSPSTTESYREDVDELTSIDEFIDIDYQMNERRAAIENYRAKPRPLLTLDEPTSASRGNFLAPLLNRHNSNESFQLFSASTDSSQRASSITGSLGSSQDSEKQATIPERWVAGLRQQKRHGGSYREAPVDNENRNIHAPERQEATSLGTLSPPDRTRVIGHHSSSLEPSYLLRPLHQEPTILHLGDIEPSNKVQTTVTDLDAKDLINLQLPDVAAEAAGLDVPHLWAFPSMICPLINYHVTKLCSSQLPAQLIFLLGPKLHDFVSLDLVISILLTYHDQLVSLSQYSQAAYLRNLAYPTYPDLSDYGSYGITPGGPWCTKCQKPSKGRRPLFCERCNSAWAECPICYGEGPITVLSGRISEPSDLLWGWCQWCGHGGHIGCLRLWWVDERSEGGCATTGCLHDCVAGMRREEALKRKEGLKKVSLVKSDRWIVEESKAVERARVLVGADTGNGSGLVQIPANVRQSSGDPVPPSLGLIGRSSSGGKKVRLLVPKEGSTLRQEETESGKKESVITTSVSVP